MEKTSVLCKLDRNLLINSQLLDWRPDEMEFENLIHEKSYSKVLKLNLNGKQDKPIDPEMLKYYIQISDCINLVVNYHTIDDL